MKQEGISLPNEIKESIMMLNAKGRVTQDDNEVNKTGSKTNGLQLHIEDIH